MVLNAPSEISHSLDDVRSRYDPAFKSGIPPHITIKRPAVFGKNVDTSALQQAIQQATGDFRAFQVKLEGYGVFRRLENNVLFLKVQDEQPFYELHHRVLRALAQLYPEGIADQFEAEKYHPHLTIGNNLSEIDLAVLEHELTSGGYQLDFSFEINEVTLFVLEPPQPWQIAGNFPFSRPFQQP